MDELGQVREAVIESRARTVHQVAALQRTFDDIVEGAELTSTDDEHDPDGATIAYERAQVWALLRQARQDLAALDEAAARLESEGVPRCRACGGAIPLERLLALPQARTCIRCAR